MIFRKIIHLTCRTWTHEIVILDGMMTIRESTQTLHSKIGLLQIWKEDRFQNLPPSDEFLHTLMGYKNQKSSMNPKNSHSYRKQRQYGNKVTEIIFSYNCYRIFVFYFFCFRDNFNIKFIIKYSKWSPSCLLKTPHQHL